MLPFQQMQLPHTDEEELRPALSGVHSVEGATVYRFCTEYFGYLSYLLSLYPLGDHTYIVNCSSAFQSLRLLRNK